MSTTRNKILLPVIVLLLGAAAAVALVSFRKTPERVERPPLGPLVEVVETSLRSFPVVVKGNGEVVPKVAVDVVPQVAGRVVEVHPDLVAGGFFSAGETLVTVDPRDYELAVERAQAAVARSLVALERERAEADVAREEWDELHPNEEPTALVVREPQIRQAEAELAAAEADLAVAQLNLERTQISVPFEGVVVSENADVGQYVSGASPVARVYGTDVVEVRVPLSSDELAWFDVPSRDGGIGAEAEVSASFGGKRWVWPGRVTRMEAQVDEISRMVHVVVEVQDPYSSSDERPSLLPGAFADVSIQGRTVEGVTPVPRHAVHDERSVWVFDDGKLRIQEVNILRSDREQTLISSGLTEGDLVIVSALDAVTDGMTVRDAAAQAAGTGNQAVGSES